MADEILIDGKTFELAEYFLEGEPEDSKDNRSALAVVIQLAVEAWFAHHESP